MVIVIYRFALQGQYCANIEPIETRGNERKWVKSDPKTQKMRYNRGSPKADLIKADAGFWGYSRMYYQEDQDQIRMKEFSCPLGADCVKATAGCV